MRGTTGGRLQRLELNSDDPSVRECSLSNGRTDKRNPKSENAKMEGKTNIFSKVARNQIINSTNNNETHRDTRLEVTVWYMYIKSHDHCRPLGAYGISPFQVISGLKCTSLAFSHDAKFCAFVTPANDISIWDTTSIPYLVNSLNCSDFGVVSSAVFSPDATALTSAFNTKNSSTTLIHWSIYDAQSIQSIE